MTIEIDHIGINVIRLRACQGVLPRRAEAAGRRLIMEIRRHHRRVRKPAASGRGQAVLLDLDRQKRRRICTSPSAPRPARRWTRSTRPRLRPAARTTASPACACTITPTTTAPSCSTPTATTSRRCATNAGRDERGRAPGGRAEAQEGGKKAATRQAAPAKEGGERKAGEEGRRTKKGAGEEKAAATQAGTKKVARKAVGSPPAADGRRSDERRASHRRLPVRRRAFPGRKPRARLDLPLPHVPEGVRRLLRTVGDGAWLAWTRGAPKHFQSSNRVRRGFCADCGTPLTYDARRNEHRNGDRRIRRPERAAPTIQVNPADRLPFVDGLPALPIREPVDEPSPKAFKATRRQLSASRPRHGGMAAAGSEEPWLSFA